MKYISGPDDVDEFAGKCVYFVYRSDGEIEGYGFVGEKREKIDVGRGVEEGYVARQVMVREKKKKDDDDEKDDEKDDETKWEKSIVDWEISGKFSDEGYMVSVMFVRLVESRLVEQVLSGLA